MPNRPQFFAFTFGTWHLAFGISQSPLTPLATARTVEMLRGLVAMGDGAMLGGVLGFVVAGAAAAVDGGVAVDLGKEGVPAIGDAAADDAEGAAFADGGTGLPTGVNAERADLAKSGRGEFAQRLQQVAGDARSGC